MGLRCDDDGKKLRSPVTFEVVCDAWASLNSTVPTAAQVNVQCHLAHLALDQHHRDPPPSLAHYLHILSACTPVSLELQTFYAVVCTTFGLHSYVD